jgi:hypothetical protein
VTEVWARGRWVLVDAQIDDLQKARFAIAFDPLDVPRSAFLLAADAWRTCRAGKADADAFGIQQMHGAWFMAGNLVRDLAALNNMEMLPWDVWGEMPAAGAKLSDAELARFDALAALLSEPDANFDKLRAVYQREWRVTPTVVNALRGCPERV